MKDTFYNAFVDECQKVATRLSKATTEVFGKVNPSGRRGVMTTTKIEGGPSAKVSPRRKKEISRFFKQPAAGPNPLLSR